MIARISYGKESIKNLNVTIALDALVKVGDVD
jgi:hypothetical protein